jgi:hypothetical protein
METLSAPSSEIISKIFGTIGELTNRGVKGWAQASGFSRGDSAPLSIEMSIPEKRVVDSAFFRDRQD